MDSLTQANHLAAVCVWHELDGAEKEALAWMYHRVKDGNESDFDEYSAGLHRRRLEVPSLREKGLVVDVLRVPYISPKGRAVVKAMERGFEP